MLEGRIDLSMMSSRIAILLLLFIKTKIHLHESIYRTESSSLAKFKEIHCKISETC